MGKNEEVKTPENEDKPIEAEPENRRRTRTKAKLEDEAPQAPQRMTRTTAKTNLKDGVEINDSDSCSKAGLAKSVSAATFRSQTTANLRALAASSKAPSASALIAEAKKGQMKAVYASGGQNRMQLLSPRPGTSSTGKGGSSNMGSRFKSR